MHPPQAFLGGFREEENSQRGQSASKNLYLKATPHFRDRKVDSLSIARAIAKEAATSLKTLLLSSFLL